MPTLRTRAAKGSELTHNELDANFDRGITQKTTTYQIVVGDNRETIECNHATTPFTVTLLTVAAAAAAETGDFEVTVTNIGAALVTLDGSGAETIDGAASITIPQYGAATVKLNAGGTAWSSLNQWSNTPTVTSLTIGSNAVHPVILATLQTPTTAAADFESIPSWATQITVSFNGLSTDGTADALVRLGDASSYEATGYSGFATRVTDSNTAVNSMTNGFHLDNATTAGDAAYGSIILTMMDSATFLWSMQGVIGKTNDKVSFISGTKALTGALTRVRVTTSNGTDLFDAGTIGLRYA